MSNTDYSPEGYKKKLYRDPKNGVFAGVCAGLGDYLGWNRNLVRFAVVAGSFFTGFFMLTFILYIAAAFILEVKPNPKLDNNQEIAANPLKQYFSNRTALDDSIDRLTQLELRLRNMETYVTSSKFRLRKEINRL